MIGMLIALVAGCSGGGGDGGPGDSVAPTARITFPPLSSEIEGSEVLVRGTADDDVGVAAVRVNGIAATSGDDFATWEALVPLSPGENQLVVEAQDLAGNVAPAAAVATAFRQGGYAIATFPENANPIRLVFDPVTRRLLGFSYPWPQSTDLVAIDVDSGFRERLQTFPQGTDPAPTGATIFGITFDPVRGRVITVGSTASSQRPVIAVDPITGIIDTLIPAPIDPRALAHDALRDRVLVFDLHSASILAVDLATLQVTEVSGPNVGSGPAISGNAVAATPQLLVDTTHDRILLLNASAANLSEAMLSIDPATGDRIESQPPWIDAVYLGAAWDEAHQRLLFLRGPVPFESELLSVDVTTGITSSLATGLFDQSWPSRSLPFDLATGRAFIRDRYGIEAIDSATGAVSVLSSWGEIGSIKAIDATVDRTGGIVYVTALGDYPNPTKIEGFDLGTGARVFTWDAPPVSLQPYRLLWDETGQRIVYRSVEAIVGLDPASGTTSVLSSASLGVGSGPALPSVGPSPPFALSSDGTRIWAASGFGAIFEVDLVTGDRTVIDEPNPSEPTAYALLNSVIADEAQQRLYLGDFNAVISLDLQSGIRNIISGRGVAFGPEFQALRGLGWDEASNRFVASDGISDKLLAIDAMTGERSLLRSGYAPHVLASGPTDGVLVAGGLFGNVGAGGSALGLLLVETGDLAILRPQAQP